MKKILAISFLTIPFLISCKGESENINDQAKTYQFQWASFEFYKIKKIFDDKFVSEAVYPDELNINEDAFRRNINNLDKSMRQLESAGKAKCDKNFLPEDANASLPEKIRNLPGAAIITDPNWDKYYAIRSSQEYINCVNTERNSKEILDLKELLEKDREVISNRAKFIESIKKNSDKALKDTVAEYAKEHQLDLVMTRQTDAIVYNKNDGVLDITIPLEAYIRAKFEKANTSTQ